MKIAALKWELECEKKDVAATALHRGKGDWGDTAWI